MSIVSAGPALTTTEIRQWFTTFDVPTPHDSVVNHLATYNGADVSDYIVTFPPTGDQTTTSLTYLVGIGYPAAEMGAWLATLDAEDLPESWVPLAIDSGGDAFVATSEGEVRYFNGDTGIYERAFDDVSTFMAALTESPSVDPNAPDYVGESIANLSALVSQRVRHAFCIGAAGRGDFAATLVSSHNTPDAVYSFLAGACAEGQTATVESLFTADPTLDPNLGHPNHWTGLMRAALGNHIDTFDYLISRNADPTLSVGSDDALGLCWTNAMSRHVQAAIATYEANNP